MSKSYEWRANRRFSDTQLDRVSGTRPQNEFRFSTFGSILFWALGAYLAIPLIDVPLLGLSLSAFMILFIVLELFLGRHVLHLRQLAVWSTLIYFLWFGFVLSITGNVFFERYLLTNADLVKLVQATFWLTTFFTIIVFVARVPVAYLRTTVIVIGFTIICTALLRLYEAFILGRIDTRGTSVIFTQNEYGILFSRFAPFAFALPFLVAERFKRSAYVGILVLIVTVAINSSRSSWIGVGIGLMIFGILYLRVNPGHFGNLFKNLLLSSLAFIVILTFLPSNTSQAIFAHIESFESLEDDYGVAVRQLMVQKSTKLFEESPIFGIGLGRFKVTEVYLETPRFFSQSKVNFNRVEPHNSYAKLLAETGLSGTIPFAVIMVLLMWRGTHAVLWLSARKHVWPIAIYASFIGMSIHLWSIDNLNNTASWFIYGLVAGMFERTTSDT